MRPLLLCFDFLVPKIEEMDERLGSLVDEFKELVYPPDYDSKGKAPREKQGEELGVAVQWHIFKSFGFKKFSLYGSIRG